LRGVAIRLRLRLSRGGHSVDVVALVNSGYETVEPEILVPPVTARELHVYPELPYGAVVGEYRLADGSTTKLIRIPRAVNVYVLEDDRVVGPVESSLVIAEKADEPLISDKLAGGLGIVALDFGEGLWCFRDEIGRVTRRSR
jgi:hypothetical protein